MPFSLIPDRLFDAYDQITPELLRGYGATLLLSDLDIKIMARLANTNFKIKYADRTYITNDENLLRRPKEIGNTGIYYETNLSAKNILQFIKELLDRYGLDREDFYFTIEKEK